MLESESEFLREHREMQVRVGKWARHNFPDETPETCTLGVAEEAGELCRAMLKRYQGIRGTREQWTEEVRKEAADVLAKLFHLAELEGFSLGFTFLERWLEIEQRDFQADPIGHGLPDE